MHTSTAVSAVPARAKERAGGGRPSGQLEREQQQLREKERGSDAVRESAPPNAREKQLGKCSLCYRLYFKFERTRK